MAFDWMKIEKETPDKPEVLRIAEASGIDPDEAFGKCFRVWRWFDSHTTNGRVSGVTTEALERRIGVPEGFLAAMQTEGWLEALEDDITLPKFERHNGETAKQRALDAERKRQRRADSGPECPANVLNEAGQNSDKIRTRQTEESESERQKIRLPDCQTDVFKKLARERWTVEDLSDTHKLTELATRIGQSRPDIFSGADVDSERIVGLAENVIAQCQRKKKIRNPIGLFFSMIRERKWVEITGEQGDRAQARLNRCRPPPVPTPAANTLAEKYKPPSRTEAHDAEPAPAKS